MDILLSEENGWVELQQGVGRLINAIVAVLGPELAPGSIFFSRCKVFFFRVLNYLTTSCWGCLWNILYGHTEHCSKFLSAELIFLSFWLVLSSSSSSLLCWYLLVYDCGLCTGYKFCVQSVVAEITCQETATMLEYVIHFVFFLFLLNLFFLLLVSILGGDFS